MHPDFTSRGTLRACDRREWNLCLWPIFNDRFYFIVYRLFTAGKIDIEELFPQPVGKGSLQSLHPSIRLAPIEIDFRSVHTGFE